MLRKSRHILSAITGLPVSDFLGSAPEGNSIRQIRLTRSNRQLSNVTSATLLFLLLHFVNFLSSLNLSCQTAPVKLIAGDQAGGDQA